MKRLLRISRRSPGLGSASAAPARGPSSRSAVIVNARGASAAVGEFSNALNEAFDEVDLDSDLDGSLKGLVHQLDQEASKYDNSKIPDDREDISWSCTQETGQLISVACKCAVGSYKPTIDIEDTPYCTFRNTHTISPSVGGTTKSSTFTVVDSRTGSTENEFFPVLVIAIRGTASKLDHMVNANETMKDASPFIDRDVLNLPRVFAHSGFLSNAEALDEAITTQIEKYREKHGQRKYHVLFTGHSAGGAVATLLFLRSISSRQLGDAARFSCITFGSPPALSWQTNPDWPHPPSQVAVVLNIINEFDLVTRADSKYIYGLARLLRQSLAPNPEPQQPKSEVDESNLEQTGSSVDENKPSDPRNPNPPDWPSMTAFLWSEKVWCLPPPRYHHVGAKVGFLMRLDGSELSLRVVKLSTLLLQQLLFCRLSVHRKACYLDRVTMLEEGRFNHQDGWGIVNNS